MKKILITNDDGYESKGLLELVKALREIASVTVVAPANEKSACGHSLTLVRPLRFISVEDDFYKLDDGTPSDCIYLSLHSLFDEVKPDLIVSGINKGSNMGEDITYSGTCAAAMEGVLHGVPSIAISQVVDFTKFDVDYTLAVEAAVMLVKKVLEGEFPLPHRQFLNVNVPSNVSELKMQVTYAGYRFYANDAHLHRNPRGEEHYWLGLHPLEFKKRDGVDGMCDYHAIENEMVSITPIQLDMSAYESINRLKEWL